MTGGRLRAAWSRAVPWVRSVLLVGAGAALVAGAAQVPTTVDLGERWASVEGDGPTGPDSQPVREVTLSCPGPEQAGLADATVSEQPMVVAVRALAPPGEALPADLQPVGAGHLLLERVPGGPARESVTGRAEMIVQNLEEAAAAVVTADGRLAPGLTAGQWHVSRAEQRRGMTAAPCLPATTDAWLLAGGSQPGRLERLVLVNPGLDPVTVRVDVLGADGPLPAPGGQGIVVPGRGRQVVLLDALAPGEERPAVHVTTTGGPVVPALGDRWLEGTLDRGLELSVPAAAPATSLVVPAVPVPAEPDAGSARLRVAVPGEVGAIVQVRALTGDGPARVENDVTTVPAGSVADIELAGLPDGTRALELTSDEPVVAALHVERRADPEGPAEMTWVPATSPVTLFAGAPLPTHAKVEYTSVLSVASQGGAVVDVLSLDASGTLRTEQLEVPAAGAITHDLTGATAVWVRPTEGQVHAAVIGGDPGANGGPLLATYPLQDLAVAHDLLPVQPWRP